MAPSTNFIGQVFSDALKRQIETLPIFLRPQLAPVLGLLLDWSESVEARLASIESDFPLLDEVERDIKRLTGPAAETALEASARIQAQIDRTCGDCNDG